MMGLAGIGPYLANFFGYALALASSYVLNRFWTFEYIGGDEVRSVLNFLAVFAVTFGAQMAILYLQVGGLSIDPYVAQPVAMMLYTVLNFLGNKHFTFK